MGAYDTGALFRFRVFRAGGVAATKLPMTFVLGISAFYHDSAAALLQDGEILGAAQEERFTRRKHDPAFPRQAVDWCLSSAGISADDVDYCVFYEKPLTKFERILETHLALSPFGFRGFRQALSAWTKEKLHTRRALRKAVGSQRPRLLFLDHHVSHAASAFFPSPFREAAILTVDGVGEWSTATYGIGRDHHIELQQELRFPHSLGLLYSAFTYYCGFKVNSGEYKLMGLAPYGQPQYADLIQQRLIDLKSDGSFWLDQRYFDYCGGLTMTNRRFDRLFGGPPRRPAEPLEQRHMDLSASVQAVTEEMLLRMARTVRQATNQPNLVLAGGVALNCVANGRLLKEGPFERIWIQPAAGDAGGALGAAYFVWHQLLERPRTVHDGDAQRGSFLGPCFPQADIARWLNEQAIPHEEFTDHNELADRTALLLSQEQVVGWFRGRMEFGPRALGNRSILGDPRSPRMQSVMNLKIKYRESFRPFAPAILREQASEWFDWRPGDDSPYMLFTAPVRSEQRVPLSAEESETLRHDPDLTRRVNLCRSKIPAVTHVDYSARLQTVDVQRNPDFHRLISAFHRLTGCPMLINTSFNVRGEPIVCTPQQAWDCFLATEMDALVLENCLIQRKQLPPSLRNIRREEHLARFELD